MIAMRLVVPAYRDVAEKITTILSASIIVASPGTLGKSRILRSGDDLGHD